MACLSTVSLVHTCPCDATRRARRRDVSRRDASMWFAPIGQWRADRARHWLFCSAVPRVHRSPEPPTSQESTLSGNLTKHSYDRDPQRDTFRPTPAPVIFARSSMRSTDRRASHFKRSGDPPSPTPRSHPSLKLNRYSFFIRSRARRVSSPSGA